MVMCNKLLQCQLMLNLLSKIKEVQVHTDIKTFKTVGTQTEHLPVQGNTNIHPDDINKLLHLEDHSYSLGPNNDSLTEKKTEK